MNKKVSLQLIADQLGVSKYTVSQALSGKPGVSESTRRRVIAMAKMLNYRMIGRSDNEAIQKRMAIRESSHPYVLVGVQSTEQNELSYWERVFFGVTAACRDMDWGYIRTVFPDRYDGPGPILSNMDLSGCVGFVMVGNCELAHLAHIRKTNLPTVLVDHVEMLLDCDSIQNDNIDAARIACHRLLSQGCRSVVFIGQDSFSVSFLDRWWGCCRAVDEMARRKDGGAALLKKWNIPYSKSSWSTHLENKLSSFIAGHGEMPDGFICANDAIALELMEILKRNGLQVPDKCKIVGIDNIERSAVSNPPLTTVELAKETLGYRAVEALKRKIENPAAQAEKIVLTSKLIIRSSG